MVAIFSWYGEMLTSAKQEKSILLKDELEIKQDGDEAEGNLLVDIALWKHEWEVIPQSKEMPKENRQSTLPRVQSDNIVK